ncbi:MAG: hypothetical protein ABEJ72_03080, partial [Candidatus Aenigmatarchaeota archaeon]
MTGEGETRELVEDIIRHDKDVYFQDSAGDYNDLAELEFPEFEVLRDGVGREQYEVEGRSVEVYVASPLEALRYGDEFQTC